MMINVACKTDRGKTRSTNEDSLLCFKEDNVFMIADGVGGHNAGEIASSLATEVTAAYIKHNPLKDVENDKELKEYFMNCFQEANASVLRVSAMRGDKASMATTALLTYVKDNRMYMVNMGDSRGYLFRDSNMMQITEDHTYVNQLVKEGKLDPLLIEDYPDKHIITRALGAEEEVIPDFFQFDVYKGDRILLCTDGLYNEVSDEEIKVLMKNALNVEVLTEELVNRAKQHGGRDNITVICLEIPR
ncbi:MAG: Stp1/IreP family PP2C-type Ser/Thr phosphatase [Anaerovoracaceae bacterium]|jgi:serine/threonine protein phosphatase PrpC